MPRLTRELALRLPIGLLVAAIVVLALRFSLCNLDSDAAAFGLMGNDILRYGYWPTLCYGQNYLFSVTPYLYALGRTILPTSLPPALVWAIAGAVLSLSGLWLMYESLLCVQRRAGRSRALAGALFCVLIAASSSYIFDIARNSGIEVSVFLTGLVMFAACRIESSLDRDGRLCRWGWFVLGLAVFHALYSRPQVIAYGVLAVAFLARRQTRIAGWESLARPAAWFVGGAVPGYVPMLLHHLFRASHWPFTMAHPAQVGSLGSIAHGWHVLAAAILPRMFTISASHSVLSGLVLLWIAWAIVAAVRQASVQRSSWSALDIAWPLGSVLIALYMVLIPDLSVNEGNRRYCLQGFIAVIWLFCRFGIPTGRRALPAVALTAAIALASLPVWQDHLRAARTVEDWRQAAEKDLIPELTRLDAVILTDYWDAYLLAFLADGRLHIEAFPWQLVRTYGATSRKSMAERTAWLIRSGYGKDARERLRSELGNEAIERIRNTPLQSRFENTECEVWELDDPSAAVRLMERYHPRYFTTRYPPGS